MRSIYLFMSLSVDGYFEGPNHDISWHNVDGEVSRFAIEQLEKTDLFLWGRRIYQLMEGYWPKAADDPDVSKEDRRIAELLNNTEKIVYSRSLRAAGETKNWRNVTLAREFDPDKVRRLKEGRGKEISVGGPSLALALARAGLIDEFRFMVNPVIIGQGTPILRGMGDRIKLELATTRRFASGNVLLSYRPAKKG